MSVNYASGLSNYANKGICGLPEHFDSTNVLEQKIEQLVDLVKNSNYIVVHTGAGVSTSIGIPDFRGPNGVWTLEKLGQKPESSISFENAQPSIAHKALIELEKHDIVKFLITQNIDGIHLRSGFPRDRLAILHGDMFLDSCHMCGTLFVRTKPTQTLGLKRSMVNCTYLKSNKRICRGKLHDTILDWEDDLPAIDYNLALEHSKKADLHICIGSSLQMLPAAELPLFNNPLKMKYRKLNGNLKHTTHELKVVGQGLTKAVSHYSKLVIINLQTTKLAPYATLNINAKADLVIKSLCDKLGIDIPCNDPVVKSDLYSWTVVLKSAHTNHLSNPYCVLYHPQNDNNDKNNKTHSVSILSENSYPKVIKIENQLKLEDYKG